MSNGWSEAIAVGSLTFVESVKNELGFKAAQRDVIEGEKVTRCANQRNLTVSDLPLKVRL